MFTLVGCDSDNSDNKVKIIDVKLTEERYAYVVQDGNK